MGSVLLGEALEDQNDLGPRVPGHCDFCSEPLPEGKELYCSSNCRKEMDRAYRNLGRTVVQIGLHWVDGKMNKGKALSRMDAVLRQLRRRIEMTRAHYGWGQNKSKSKRQ